MVRVKLADQSGKCHRPTVPEAQHPNALGRAWLSTGTGTQATPVHEVRVVSAILVAGAQPPLESWLSVADAARARMSWLGRAI